MSIQVLPPEPSIGRTLSETLGPAIARGGQQQFQRGQTQEALSGLGNLPAGSSPFELAKALISATAGIPGAERYVGQLFPLLLNQMQSQAAFPSEGGESPLPAQSTGYLGQVYSPAQIARASEEYAKKTGTGIEGKNQYASQLRQDSQLAEQRRAELANYARTTPEIQRRPELEPLFLRSALKFPNVAEPEALKEAAYRDFQNEIADLTKLEGRDFNRIADLNTLGPTLQDLEKKGLGAAARSTLNSKHLRPYQYSHLFNPLTKEQKIALERLPPAALSKGNPQGNVGSFLEKHLTSESPLPSIAMAIYRKGYDTANLGQQMRAILGDRITQRQNLDLADIETGEFKIPSMQEIFRPGQKAFP